jgi:formate transporter
MNPPPGPSVPASPPIVSLDAVLPPEMARKAEDIGVQKAGTPVLTTFVLAVLAGAFIGLGAAFMTTVTAGPAAGWPFGAVRLIGGLAFCLGLVLVVVAGAELFTGNNLIVMAWADGRVGTGRLLRNWVVVYLGNFVGAVATAAFVFAGEQYRFGNGATGANALAIADAKVKLGFTQAVALGTICNALVCLAVWLTYSARTTTDKILCVLFPITAFVACGFEHSVANMYLVPVALLIRAAAPAPFWNQVGRRPTDYPDLTWNAFLADNLLPVTIGNVLGGSVMVGLVYWLVYVRLRRK